MPKSVPKKIEMTEPGSRYKYRMTYPNGEQKWTRERPGHKSEKWKIREKKRLLRDPAIREFLGRLTYVVNSYLDGGSEKEDIEKVVRDFETTRGWNKARMVVRRVKRSESKKLEKAEGDMKDRQQEIVDALDIAVDFVNRRRRDKKKSAGLREVVEKIVNRIRDDEIVKRLVDKVKRFVQTKNPADDLTLQEAAMIYAPVDYGELVPLSNKRDLDIEWSKHAEYRSDLRDVKPERVNDMIQERLREKVPHPDRKKVNFHEPGLGTVVVDYDMMDKPAEADVITVWAGELVKMAKEI